MDLQGHIHSVGTIADISAHLQNLAPGERWAQLASLSKRDQRTLYLKAEISEPLTPADFVPEDTPVGTGIRYAGKNSLPLFRDFHKPMARTSEGTIFGFNEQPFRGLIGPGYFLMRETVGNEVPRAAMVVDYHVLPAVPDGELPADFPPLKANSSGLQYFVYHNTRDYMRRVAPGVMIGSAWKTFMGTERSLNSYFLLMRPGS
jgi:hypothetical protein